MKHWLDAAHQLTLSGQSYVLITILAVQGSAPRDEGTKMVVTVEQAFDTIGGGHLEYQCLVQARSMLQQKQQGQCLKHYPLAAKLGQCCGGQVSVLFEYFAATLPQISVFGAGHVGRALVNILSQLPCQVTWVDSRQDQFALMEYPEMNNVTRVLSDGVADVVDKMQDNSYFVVMTHDHQLDFDICCRILQRKSFNYLGLIASHTKWRRFQQRFAHRDIDGAVIAKMNCPIGLSAVGGKQPGEIAVAIAAELIATYQAHQNDRSEQTDQPSSAVSWQQLKHLSVSTNV